MAITQRIKSLIEAPNPRGLSSSQLFVENEDLKPVESARRLWRGWNFVTFWIADGFNLNTWYIASSMIVAGLSWWQAWICVWIGYTFTGFMVAAGARPGAIYHIGFPVFARSSFGIFGSLWPVLNRAVIACIWTGVQSAVGGQCMTLLIRSLAPGFANIHNGIPESVGITTPDFIGFFLFILCHGPLVWFPVEKIRHFFTVKAVLAPASGIAYFAWIMVKAGGVGPVVHQPATASGSALGWAFTNGVMACVANFATLVCNASDFSRFAAKPKNAVWPQIIAIPLTFSLVSLLGVLVASATTLIYGSTVWSPLTMLDRTLSDDPYNSGNRAGVFFIMFCFIIAQLGTNIAANTISAGSDLTALAPRYITIRRGGYVAVIAALCMQPWRLLESSNNFTSYLSAYSCFLSAIIGVLLSDYYFVRKGKLYVPDLYSLSKKGSRWFTLGVNWRAYVGYLCGIAPNMPGFVGSVAPSTNISEAAIRIYELSFFVGMLCSGGAYYLACRLSPPPGMVLEKGWHEPMEGFEPEDMYSESEVSQVVYTASIDKSADDDELAKY